jgi:ABC-2 type transport system ATP-binding protein
MIIGLAPPDSGRSNCWVSPAPIYAMEIKRRIGLVPDEIVAFRPAHRRRVPRVRGRMYGLERRVARERAGELLALFELDGERASSSRVLQGDRKRASMAAALIHRPDLLLLDEPFEGVDGRRRAA